MVLQTIFSRFEARYGGVPLEDGDGVGKAYNRFWLSLLKTHSHESV